MRDVLSKPASTDIARVAAALKQQFDAGSGFSRVRILITEGKGRKPTPLKWSPRETLDRLLGWDDFVDEAAEFEGRAAPSEEFWKDWLSAAMSAPSEFRARSKLTVKKQIAAIRSITTAAARLQKTLEHALVVPSPDLSETKYLEEVAKLRVEHGSIRVPSLIDLQVTLPSVGFPELRKKRYVGIGSLVSLLQNAIAALEKEGRNLARAGDSEQLNKGYAPQRALAQRLEATLRDHFNTLPKNFLGLVAATVNATYDLSGNAGLDRKAVSDSLKYGRKKRR